MIKHLKMVAIGAPFVAAFIGACIAAVEWLGLASFLIIPLSYASWAVGNIVTEAWSQRK